MANLIHQGIKYFIISLRKNYSFSIFCVPRVPRQEVAPVADVEEEEEERRKEKKESVHPRVLVELVVWDWLEGHGPVWKHHSEA